MPPAERERSRIAAALLAAGRKRGGHGVIELQELTPGDWELWRKLRLEALEEAPHAFWSTLADWQGAADQPARWRSRLALPNAIHLAARLDGEPAGMASGVPSEEAGVAELLSMWVAPAARGHGVGDALVKAVDHWARQEQFGVLRLAVVEDNARAERLYQRHGFVVTAEFGGLMPDGIRREHIMEKTLGM